MSKWVQPPLTEATLRQRARRAKNQGGICPACGLPLPEDLTETEVDHIIPRSRGGPSAPWNKRLVHFKCNRAKWCRLTDEAVALAAEHGITLREPGPIGRPRVIAHYRRLITAAAADLREKG